MTGVDGSGYGRIAVVPKEDETLTHVGFGTPMGELLRRYWQPVALLAELQDLPKRIRILCEDLVVFRDGSGRAGVSPQMLSSRHVPRIRPARGRRYPLLLSRLEVRRRRALPGTTGRATTQRLLYQSPTALVSGARVRRARVRLYGAAGQEAGIPHLRHLVAGRLQASCLSQRQPRRGRRMQLVADPRERDRPVPHLFPPLPAQRASVHRGLRGAPGRDISSGRRSASSTSATRSCPTRIYFAASARTSYPTRGRCRRRPRPERHRNWNAAAISVGGCPSTTPIRSDFILRP